MWVWRENGDNDVSHGKPGSIHPGTWTDGSDLLSEEGFSEKSFEKKHVCLRNSIYLCTLWSRENFHSNENSSGHPGNSCMVQQYKGLVWVRVLCLTWVRVLCVVVLVCWPRGEAAVMGRSEWCSRGHERLEIDWLLSLERCRSWGAVPVPDNKLWT